MKLKEVVKKLGAGVKSFGKVIVKPMTKKRIIAMAIVSVLGAFGVTMAPDQAEMLITIVLSLF